MQRKLKTCKGTGKFAGHGCGKEKFIFGYGLCQVCYQRANFKPAPAYGKNAKVKKRTALLKFRPTIQDEVELKQSDTFLLAWNYWEGRCLIGGYKIELNNLQAWNCMHVLDKKNYHYFKYYYKNIVLGLKEQHDLIDKGTQEQIAERIKSHYLETQDQWDSYFRLRESLLFEYKAWISANHATHKLG